MNENGTRKLRSGSQDFSNFRRIVSSIKKKKIEPACKILKLSNNLTPASSISCKKKKNRVESKDRSSKAKDRRGSLFLK